MTAIILKPRNSIHLLKPSRSVPVIKPGKYSEDALAFPQMKSKTPVDEGMV